MPAPSPSNPAEPAPAAPKRRRHLLWAAAAVLLLFGAALLLTAGEDGPTPTHRDPVDFPRGPRAHERELLRKRATLVLPARADAPDAPRERRDPFLVALPAGPKDPVIVLEANALRHSKLGELLIGCALARDPETFGEIERETGIDVLKDVDRVGFAGEAMVVSGFFDRAHWDRLEKDPAVRISGYGDAGRLYTTRDGPVLGVVGDGLMVFGDAAAVRQAIDQVEGRAPAPQSLPDELAYGEIYGVLPGAAAGRLAGPDAQLAQQIAAVAQQVELHVDAMSDVAAVVRVRGDDRPGLQDLSKSLGAALTAARLHANALSDDTLAELLDFARVVPGDEAFSLELAVPADRLEAWFSRCAPPAPAEAPDGAGAAPAADGAGGAAAN